MHIRWQTDVAHQLSDHTGSVARDRCAPLASRLDERMNGVAVVSGYSGARLLGRCRLRATRPIIRSGAAAPPARRRVTRQQQ